MPALAYLLPPVTGLVAYLLGSSARARRHGLQSVVFGVLWPAALLVASALDSGLALPLFGAGVVVWLVLLVATAAGADLHLPGTAGLLERASRSGPRDPRRNPRAN